MESQLCFSSDGWDNPFRPDGDLSKEADQIVELIKEGKPITPTPTSALSPLLPDHDVDSKHDQQAVTSTPTKANGTCCEKNAVPPNVEVQRGNIYIYIHLLKLIAAFIVSLHVSLLLLFSN